MEIDHYILNTLNKEEVNKAEKLVNKKKIYDLFNVGYTLNKEEKRLIKKVLNYYELTLIDLWDFAFYRKKENFHKRVLFHKISLECFNLIQILPLPKDTIKKIKYVLKFITFAYLGEKWEDVRKVLITNKKIWDIEDYKPNDWDKNLFIKIYKSILYLVRKSSWKDLQNAIDIIIELKKEQEKYEAFYINGIDLNYQKGSAFELASLYHLARSVELIVEYMLQGTPNDILEQLNFHFSKAIEYCQNAGIIELDLILRMLFNTFKKMIFNSLWYLTNKINSRVSKFIKSIIKSNNPIFELLYPQRVAILEKGLLDPANKAIVVNMPTSSGKTLIAEFRILQALNQFAEEKGWIAYVVPTRALVNQITVRLRNSLGRPPLNIKIEKISGALEIDTFEENLLKSKDLFDILVTTPEKLSLLIRQGIESQLMRPLVLTIIDEAHNIGDPERGLNLEILVSIIKKDCKKANFLLLTPLIPNSNDIAEWLDPLNPRSISIKLDWQPNERVIGIFYASGKRRQVELLYKPLITSRKTIELENVIQIDKTNSANFPASELITRKNKLTAFATQKLIDIGNILVVSRTKNDTWNIAELISNMLPNLGKLDNRLEIVKSFIAMELGTQFPLINLLNKGIGVHNSGLPDEIKYLMEWLMEIGLLKVLVATTTIAQGINFPISAILMASYTYPYKKTMPVKDFWNLIGRAGRIDQHTLGFIGIAVNKKDSNDISKVTNFVKESVDDLISILVKMVDDAIKLGEKLNLRSLAYYPQWSIFLQYISHMYNQSKDLENFLADIEINLRATYGFNHLEHNKKNILLNAVKNYAYRLDKNRHLATLSDKTGFSPETIGNTINKVNQLNIKQSDWNRSRLFSSTPNTLTKLMGIMIKDIPEIKDKLNIVIKGKTLTFSSLARLISDWVSGKNLVDISEKYFGSKDTKTITKCISKLYSQIINYATWGLASIQKLPRSGIDYENLTEEEKKQINNLPAMIYYGVNTDEAILMRMNNVPRSIAQDLGELFKKDFPDINNISPSKVNEWLKNLEVEEWDKILHDKKMITGEDYKKIWSIISGIA